MYTYFTCSTFNNSKNLVCNIQKLYKFVIGYHELEGTKVPLRKPMVIMKKVKLDDDMEVDSVSSTPLTAASLEMRVVGVVRHKLLFKNRPKAIISSKSPLSPFGISWYGCPAFILEGAKFCFY